MDGEAFEKYSAIKKKSKTLTIPSRPLRRRRAPSSPSHLPRRARGLRVLFLSVGPRACPRARRDHSSCAMMARQSSSNTVPIGTFRQSIGMPLC